MAGRLQSDPLFQGLTRPTMVFGVSYMFFVANALISMLVFINTQKFLIVILVAGSVHLAAFLICAKEPRAIEMFLVKAKKGFKCMNRPYHGHTNSYDLF